MTSANEALSSATANQILSDRKKRNDRMVASEGRLSDFFGRLDPGSSAILTAGNMVGFGWTAWMIAAYSGVGADWSIAGFALWWVPCTFMALMGAAMGLSATNSISRMLGANGASGFVAALLAASILIPGSGATSVLLNASFFEGSNSRAQISQAEIVALETTLSDAGAATVEAQLLHARASSAEQDAVNRAQKSREGIDAAERRMVAWEEAVKAKHGPTSAAWNARTDPSHPDRVVRVKDIKDARDTYARDLALIPASEKKRKETGENLTAARTAERKARDALVAATTDEEPNLLVRTAETFAPWVGLTGFQFLLVIAIALGMSGTVLPVCNSVYSWAVTAKATKSAVAKADAVSGRRETVMQQQPTVTYGMSAVSFDASSQQVTQPQPKVTPVQEMKHFDRVQEALDDYHNPDPDETLSSLGITYLKRRYGGGDPAAKSIRKAFVEQGYAMMDGDKCYLVGGRA